MRYRGSVEDRVHELLSGRLDEDMYGLSDVLEDVWIIDFTIYWLFLKVKVF
jgi:hypothetical protein